MNYWCSGPSDTLGGTPDGGQSRKGEHLPVLSAQQLATTF